MPYFPPNQPDFNYLRHLQLVCWGPDQRPAEKELAYHVAHIDADGEPDGWFFDSFLPLTARAATGGFLYNDINLGTTRSGEGDFFAVPSPNPGRAVDWTEALDSLFDPKDGFLAVLERTIAGLKGRLGAPPHRRNVVITVPYPHPNQCCFGAVRKKGPRLNFGIVGQNLAAASEQRLDACRWFVDEAVARWKRAAFRELHLLGFYWIYESLHYSWDVDDHWVLKELYKEARVRSLRMFWIPFYSSFNVHLLDEGRGSYFDAAFLQPNHIFYRAIPGVEQAAREARERGAGVEMEYYLTLDPAYSVGREKPRRWRSYLNGGVEFGYMTESACAYFIGPNDLYKMAVHKDRRERGAYHDLFHFVKGDYTPR